MNDSVRALLFGVLATLAAPRVEHYRSDLFHDVHWLDAHVTEPTSFYFGCDAWGTAIGTDLELVKLSRKETWRVELVAEFSEFATDDAATWFALVESV